MRGEELLDEARCEAVAENNGPDRGAVEDVEAGAALMAGDIGFEAAIAD